MKKFEVTGVQVRINQGQIVLTADQARRRRHLITAIDVDEETGAGLYNIDKPIAFKNGEVFSCDADISKVQTRELSEPENVAVTKETASVKQASKKKASKKVTKKKTIKKKVTKKTAKK